MAEGIAISGGLDYAGSVSERWLLGARYPELPKPVGNQMKIVIVEQRWVIKGGRG